LRQIFEFPDVPPYGPAFRHKYFAEADRGKYVGNLELNIKGDWIFELSMKSPSGVF
jgi:hypothetical protein